MIKHIVLFKLSESLSSENKQKALGKMQEIFSPLREKLPFIIEYRTGISFNESGSSWDFAIDSTFLNKADLKRYIESPEHLDAIRQGSVIKKTKAIVDYEF